MTVELHTFDPDGDLLLLLPLPPPKEDSAADKDSDQANDSGDNVADGDNRDAVLDITADDVADGQTGTEAPQEAHTLPDDPTLQLSGSDRTKKSEEAKPEESNLEVHMLVSSKHMMLASPVFRAMLRLDSFKEGKALHSAGKVEVALPDDNAEAFVIILNIIHGRTREVPRTLVLSSLAAISILVDKYQIQEVVEIFSDGWIEDLKVDLPTSYLAGLNVMTWIGVTWVFRKPDEFRQLTRIVEKEADDRFEEDIQEGTPIPQPIIDAIKSHRNDALFDLYALLEHTIKRYQRPEVLCPLSDKYFRQACDALLLGSLLKSSSTAGIWPPPDSPYPEVDFTSLVGNIRGVKITTLCDKSFQGRLGGTVTENAHGLKTLIEEKIASLEERLCGLDLEEFQKQTPKKITN